MRDSLNTGHSGLDEGNNIQTQCMAHLLTFIIMEGKVEGTRNSKSWIGEVQELMEVGPVECS